MSTGTTFRLGRARDGPAEHRLRAHRARASARHRWWRRARHLTRALRPAREQVDVIELNEGIREVVDEDLARILRVALLAARREHGHRRWPISARGTRPPLRRIHIGFTDTLSANAAQGSPSRRTTCTRSRPSEEYLDHLKPGGVLDVSRSVRRRRQRGDSPYGPRVGGAANGWVSSNPERNAVVVLGRDILGEESATVLARLTPIRRASSSHQARSRTSEDVVSSSRPAGPQGRMGGTRDARGWHVLRGLPRERLPTHRRQAVLLQHEPAEPDRPIHRQ